MGKHNEIKRMIERAVAACSGSEMREVRSRLADSLAALKRAESKNKKETQSPISQWSFDISTCSLRNLTRGQAEDALGEIERMIGDEKKRFSDSEEGLITG